MKITELGTEKFFTWFDKICRIPHGSGNTSAISDFCEEFAKSRGLDYRRDSLGNVVIFKDASSDRVGSSPVILQGHLDMVCDKTPDCSKDMTAEGITPLTDGEYITADKTTLGADDGIAAAYILAVLDSDDLSHPPIEAVLTVDEEIGLIGASALDCSVLRGRRGINIDSEEEGIITVSCAGGVRVNCSIPAEMTALTDASHDFVKLSVSGLLGGHSGIDIDKNRQNAIVVLAGLLDRLNRKVGVGICTLSGGTAMNIIPKSAEAVVACGSGLAAKIIDETEKYFETARMEYRITEPQLCITAEKCTSFSECTDKASTEKVIFTLVNALNGVFSMNPEIPGMVMDSLNMGTAVLDGGKLAVCSFVRSNDNYGKNTIVDRLRCYYEYLGGELELMSDYPAWTYKTDSPLRDRAVAVYEDMYGSEPQILAIHAGLECGILSSKLDDADFISFGPDIENAHTPQERLSVSSARRCYEYLIRLLRELD